VSTESEKKLDWVNMCKTCTAQQITGFSHSSEGLYKKSSKQGHTVEHNIKSLLLFKRSDLVQTPLQKIAS